MKFDKNVIFNFLSIQFLMFFSLNQFATAKMLNDKCEDDAALYETIKYPGPLKYCKSLGSAKSGFATESVSCVDGNLKSSNQGSIIGDTTLLQYRVNLTLVRDGKSKTCTISYPNRRFPLPTLTLKEFLSLDLKQKIQDYTSEGVIVSQVSPLDFGLPADTPFYDSMKNEPRIAGTDAYQSVLTCLRHPIPELKYNSGFTDDSGLTACGSYGTCLLVKKGESISPGLYILSNNGHKYIALSDKELKGWNLSDSLSHLESDLSQKVKAAPVIIDKNVKAVLSEKVAAFLDYFKKDAVESRSNLLSHSKKISHFDDIKKYLHLCKAILTSDKSDMKKLSLKLDDLLQTWSEVGPSAVDPADKNFIK